MNRKEKIQLSKYYNMSGTNLFHNWSKEYEHYNSVYQRESLLTEKMLSHRALTEVVTGARF